MHFSRIFARICQSPITNHPFFADSDHGTHLIATLTAEIGRYARSEFQTPGPLHTLRHIKHQGRILAFSVVPVVMKIPAVVAHMSGKDAVLETAHISSDSYMPCLNTVVACLYLSVSIVKKAK